MASEDFMKHVRSDTGELLRKSWKPDGKTINPANEARLQKWKKRNGLENVSVTAFLVGERFNDARTRAATELRITNSEG
jgi:hypothetical protein